MRALSRPNPIPVSGALLVAFVACFGLRSWYYYDPFNGYDAESHIYLIRAVARSGTMPLGAYGSSNGPFYYFLSAGIFRIFHSYKAVQFFSLVLYFLNIGLFYHLAGRYVKSVTREIVTLFYAMLPLTIEYGVMVFNYTLNHALTLLSLYLIATIPRGKKTYGKWVFVLAGLAVTNVMVSLTGLANVAINAIAIALFPARDAKQRARYLLGYFAVCAIVLGIYFIHRKVQIGCIFCTLNRPKGHTGILGFYRFSFYFSLPQYAFTAPYFPHGFALSLPGMMIDTFFTDYFNYLIPRRLVSQNPFLQQVKAGAYFMDTQRILQFRLQAMMGLVLLGGLITAVFSSIKRMRSATVRDHALPVVSWVFFAAGLLTILQFLVYIHRYQNRVNIHAGYVYPLAFLGCLCLARWLSDVARPRTAIFLQSLMVVYSLVNVWTFWF